MTKVLFLYEPVGSGHQMAAEALEMACRTLAPDWETDVLDPFGEIWFGIPALMTGINTVTLLLAPHLHDEVWRGSDQGLWIEKLVDLPPLRDAFLDLMRRFSPDLVVTTHDMPCSVLAELRQSGIWDMPVAAVVTDFAAHPYWPTSGVDQYLVAAPEVRDQLVQRGMDARRVAVTGIPISTEFGQRDYAAHPGSQAECRRQLGLLDMPTVLIIAGGLRMGPYVSSQLVLDQMVQELDGVPEAFQVAIVTGGNSALKRYMEGRVRRLTHPVHVLGYVTNMPDYMLAADVVVSKPGGLITSEALALGLPMISFKAGPGQERANQEYLLSRGAAVAAAEADEVADVVGSLLADPLRLAELRRCARAIGRPHAAMEGARILAGMVAYQPAYEQVAL